ncbi:ribonuclease P protein subunit p40, partial [Aspergillus homomorphus CBS 101889]
MLEFNDDASRREKCFTCLGQLPPYIDPKQPPTKKAPFAAVLGHPFIHTVEVTLPKEAHTTIQASLDSRLQKLRYARVFMSLSSLLEPDFFNTYIKTGNILMISEGRSGSDSVFTLRDGILKLELSREIFERTGLTGKPVRSGGRKHAKERYVIELNLRLPSMLHGKKGFKRIEYAFQNVLTQSVAWLFFDLSSTTNGIADDDLSLKGNHPQIIPCEPVLTEHPNILVPPLDTLKLTDPPSTAGSSSSPEALQNQCTEIAEWLAMVSLASPRVSAADDVDPYLSRYCVPDADEAKATDLVTLRWRGLIPSKWVVGLLVDLLRETAASSSAVSSAWFAISAQALGREAVEARDGYTLLVLPALPAPAGAEEEEKVGKEEIVAARRMGRHFVSWEFVGASVL